ncbi:MAG: polymer-forming cytoskeletal protein [Simkaniaceae bacterium]|nr:polymer-forming cytoskeletal protein [Simkaniaceae bacterium]
MRFLLFLLPIFALFADDSAYVVLPHGTTIQGDYFARGSTVEISGHIKGDLFVLASQAFVDGTVDGSILFVGGELSHSGYVGQNIRGAGGHVVISGDVGGSVSVVAGSLDLSPKALIKGNVVGMTGTADFASRINGNIRISSSFLRLSDGVGGFVTANVGQLRITSKANVKGPITYWSTNDAHIDSNAKLTGGIKHEDSIFSNVTRKSFIKKLSTGSKLATILMNFFYSLVVGLVLLRYYRNRVDTSYEVLTKGPVRAFLTGVMIAILLPLISLFFLMTIVGAPFALTLIAVNVIGFYMAKVISILWITRLSTQRFRIHRFEKLNFFFALIIYFILVRIPYVGLAISIVATLLGVGAAILKNKTVNN